tara:strand:- start:586 stop:870 length:285 start_codon:yes stop_codon:yes gene_type:complete
MQIKMAGVRGLKVNKINDLQGSVTNTLQYTITDPELTIFGKQYDVIEFPCLLIFSAYQTHSFKSLKNISALSIFFCSPIPRKTNKRKTCSNILD